jgi:two-component system, chemotaxis family, sensor kinase CheA
VSALHEQFVTEARELVRQATDDLIAIEREGVSSSGIDRVFRTFHTLKGSAGVVELPAMSIMLHAAEDLLASVKHEALKVNGDIIDSALACLDQVSRWVDDFESAGTLPSEAGEQGRAIAERLRLFLRIKEDQDAKLPGQKAAPDGGVEALPEWALRLIAAVRDGLPSRMPKFTFAAWAISYEPIAGCFYNGDDPVQLMRQLPDLLAFHIEPREPFPPLVDIDPYACNLRLQAISAGDRAEISAIFRLVPDQVRIIGVPLDALPTAQTHAAADNLPLIRTVIRAQCELLSAACRKDDFVGCVGAAARVAANALRHGDHPQLADKVKRAGAAALSLHDSGPLLAALEQALASFDGSRSIAADVKGLTVSTPDIAERLPERVLRVSEAKIEALVNLAGELVVAKNGLAHSAKRIGQALGQVEMAASIQRDHDVINRLVMELHSTILQLRMVPVAQVFQSFPRLVRDLSRQLDKNIALVTRGDTTEADKTIVDRLFEPLVHLVRNAVDHGIESSAQRSAARKSEIATISMAALRVGDRLMVEVTDDGRGVDASLIRRKAIERRLMRPDELIALTDEQVVDLVFASGFSTAADVSDISGRGIGMDVVRTAVEQIGGRVSLQSEAGSGTTVRLDLPMAIAMSRIIVVETSGELFGILMDAVSETVRIPSDLITQIKNNNAFVLRDRIVPIVLLSELMKLPQETKDVAGARLFVVIEDYGKIAALEIDAICNCLDVVLKPMQGLLAGARGYAGTTLLGNGRVLLVLNLKELLP